MTIDRELRASWPVVMACFCVAIFSWGFGFYGQSLYLAELHRLRGWPITLLSSVTTCFYLGAACLMPVVDRLMRALGPRWVLLSGVTLMAVGASGYCRAVAPWQLFAAGGAMAAGWAFASGPAIATTLAFWFDRRRGMAISLALNGASASAFIVSPMLVRLNEAFALPRAVPIAAASGWVLVAATILFCVGHPPAPGCIASSDTDGGQRTDSRLVMDSQSKALRRWRFWSVALPFALGTGAQVGFIVHMVTILLPTMGPAGTSAAVSAVGAAAMVGRLGLGTVIDRLPQRPISAICFLSQAMGMCLILAFPSAPSALFAGSILFGLSVGNVITLPAILVGRAFAARSFGMVVGLSGAIVQFALALAPALFGLLHDASGGYGIVLTVCIGLQVLAAVLVVIG